MNSVLIVGNPNSGKSTLFNALTGKDAKVGNFHGVTVKLLSGVANINGKKFTVVDTPGIYSLAPVSLEEEVTLNAIKNFNGIIIFLLEAVTLYKCLDLLKGVYSLNKKVILAVNMITEFYKLGGVLNENQLIKSLPFPTIIGDFNGGKGVENIKNAILNYKESSGKINTELYLSCATIPEYKESKLDRLFTGKYSFLTVILTVSLGLYLAFGKYGAGVLLGSLFSKLVEFIALPLLSLANNLNPFLSGFIKDGVISGVLGVSAFIPQMLTLLTFLTFLERSGVMARLSYITESLFYKTGLNGRAVFSIIMGFGCTAVGVSLSGGLETKSAKNKAILTLSGVSCSAKIPVFTLLSASCNAPFLYMLLVYVFIVLVALLNLYLADRFFVKSKRVPLVMELPPYRLPPIKELLKSLLKLLKQSIIKIGTVIFLISLVVYLLKSVTPTFKYAVLVEDSVLCVLGKVITPIFYPLGITDWKISTALVAGVLQKKVLQACF